MKTSARLVLETLAGAGSPACIDDVHAAPHSSNAVKATAHADRIETCLDLRMRPP
jgi:hypothetical protein